MLQTCPGGTWANRFDRRFDFRFFRLQRFGSDLTSGCCLFHLVPWFLSHRKLQRESSSFNMEWVYPREGNMLHCSTNAVPNQHKTDNRKRLISRESNCLSAVRKRLCNRRHRTCKAQAPGVEVCKAAPSHNQKARAQQHNHPTTRDNCKQSSTSFVPSFSPGKGKMKKWTVLDSLDCRNDRIYKKQKRFLYYIYIYISSTWGLEWACSHVNVGEIAKAQSSFHMQVLFTLPEYPLAHLALFMTLTVAR